MSTPNIPGLPAGATLGAPVQQSTTVDQSAVAGLPAGATVGAPVQADTPVSGQSSSDSTAPRNDELQYGSSVLGNIAKTPVMALEGVGEGVFKTAAGASDIIDKVTGQTPGTVNKFLHTQAGDNNTPGSSTVANKVGNGLEDVMEFVMGDEALKALPLSQRLAKATKLAQLAEESPMIARALRAGANAIRGGAVGAVQGGLNSGGNPSAVRSGATLGATAGAVAPLAGEAVSKVAGKAAEAVAPLVENIKAAVKPGIVQDAIQSEMRDVINDFAKEAGVSPSTAPSIRDLAHEIAGNLEAKAKASYQALDDALGGRAQRFRDAVKNVQAKIRELNGIDPDQEGAYVEKLNDLQDAHDKAMTEANDVLKSQGKDTTAKQLLDQANSDFRTSKRMLSVSRDIRGAVDDTTTRPEIATQSQRPTPERVDTKKLVTRLNKSYNRGDLQDALGQQRAQRLLAAANDAHATTEAAATLRKVAIRSALVGSIPGLGVLFHYLGE